MTNRWQPGDHVTLREIWLGRIWSGRPYTVVEDTPNRLLLYAEAGVRWMKPDPPDRLREPAWTLYEDTWYTEALRIVSPGSRHSVLLLWTPGFRELLLWYVNLETSMTRTPIGFDYLDQLLDIEIAPDLSVWSWKDEDEFEGAIAAGLLPPDEARAVRSEAEEVIAALDAGRPPFDEPWPQWRPDPAWTPPSLPKSWNDLHKYPPFAGRSTASSRLR